MSSNGMVALKKADGSVRCSYVICDFSAYEGQKELYKYFLTPERVDALLDFGTIEAVYRHLYPYFNYSVRTFTYKNNEGELVEDKRNFVFNTFEEFMDAAYRDNYISDPVCRIMLFDEETNEWYIVNNKTRKIVPFEEHYLDRFEDTLEELQEYLAFVKSLISPEAFAIYEAHNRQYGRYMHEEFDETTYYRILKLRELERNIEKAKQNGGILPKDSVVDLSDEEELECYEDIFKGRSRKPEIMDFVIEQMYRMTYEEIEEKIVRNGLQITEPIELITEDKEEEIIYFVFEQMKGMTFEEIEEKIVRNGLKAPEKQETTQVTSNSLEKANIYLKVVEQIGYEQKKATIVYLPITQELENMKVSEIPALLGIKDATIEVYHDKDGEKRASSVTINTWIPFAKEVTIKNYALFSLMEAIENHASMQNTLNRTGSPIDERTKKAILEELAETENLALSALRKVIDEETLKIVVDRTRKLNSQEGIYDLINELGILETEQILSQKK